jgi:creatinine amidohydrolase/Fe(II)-dependent formamide hydrolase-like protein
MKKLVILAAAAALTLAGAAFAADSSDVSADNTAIAKDNTALAKDHQVTNENRAAKAKAKANGDTVSQAYDSAKIGANQATASAKEGEKGIDNTVKDNDTH